MRNVLIFGSIVIGLALFLGPFLYSEFVNPRIAPKTDENIDGTKSPVATEASVEESKMVSYRCAGDTRFTAEYSTDTVRIQMPNGNFISLEVYKTDSSGTWFKQDSKDVYMFVKGPSSFVTDKGADVYAQCVATTT
jgi:hypothetical protein